MTTNRFRDGAGCPSGFVSKYFALDKGGGTPLGLAYRLSYAINEQNLAEGVGNDPTTGSSPATVFRTA